MKDDIDPSTNDWIVDSFEIIDRASCVLLGPELYVDVDPDTDDAGCASSVL